MAIPMESVKTIIETFFCIAMPVLGLSYLLQAGHWIRYFRELTDHPHRILPMALAMLTIGTVCGLAYDDWSTSWPIFISAFCWLLALKGAIILVYPRWLARLKKIPDSFMIWYMRSGGILFIILGAMLYRHFFVL
jgi:hypothetical protein